MPKGERAKGESAQVGENAQEGESAQGRECPRGQECLGESAKGDGIQDGHNCDDGCNGHKIRLQWRMTAPESRRHSSIPWHRGLVQAQLGPTKHQQQQKPCVWQPHPLPREGIRLLPLAAFERPLLVSLMDVRSSGQSAKA